MTKHIDTILLTSAPESSLVERVADAIAAHATSAGIVNDRPARAAILEVAAWLREQHGGDLIASTVLRREANPIPLTRRTTTVAELSPAAQAVWHAYETANCDPYFIDPRQAGVAAALLAVADQVVPEDFDYWDGRTGDYASGCETGQNERNAHVRRELFVIAAALVDPNFTSEGG